MHLGNDFWNFSSSCLEKATKMIGFSGDLGEKTAVFVSRCPVVLKWYNL